MRAASAPMRAPRRAPMLHSRELWACHVLYRWHGCDVGWVCRYGLAWMGLWAWVGLWTWVGLSTYTYDVRLSVCCWHVMLRHVMLRHFALTSLPA